MFTLNVVAAESQQLDDAAHTVTVTAPKAERCCRTKFRKVSGGRPLAAARTEGSVSIRAIVVLSSNVLAWVGRCWIIASLTRPPEWTAAAFS
jgi:hypothetical protein